MLPFLKNQHESGVSGPVQTVKREPDQEPQLDLLEEAIEELFQAKSKEARAAAFKAAFQICESEPHIEDHNG